MTFKSVSRRVLVSGDVVVDHHLYQGARTNPAARQKPGVRHISAIGGAEGVRTMIQEIAKLVGNGRFATTLGMVVRDITDIPEAHHAYAIWAPHKLDRDPKSKEMVWRTSVRMGYGQSSNQPDEALDWHLKPAAVDGPFDLIVLDDAGVVFRKAPNEACWHLPPPERAPWILLKLADPVAESDLWRRLVPAADKGYEDKLICLVSASDLRREAAMIRHGSSWDRTLEDLRDALATHALSPLLRCRHLVITFDVDAAIWLQPHEDAWFYFAPADAEGDFADRTDGRAVGYMTAMAGALGYGICQANGEDQDLGEWIVAGLRAMRHLHRYGHGRVTDGSAVGPCGYPFEELSAEIMKKKSELARQESELVALSIGWPPPKSDTDGAQWTLLEASLSPPGDAGPRSLLGLACDVARRGERAYGKLPHAVFGSFITAERREIEMLRNISRLMGNYNRTAKTGDRPLSIGVFGPPGAGKSFAVKEIANKKFGSEAWLEFNLSQFSGAVDLNGALHQVRDKVLGGLIPVVFWDEFDSQGLRWLQYLLAPMQDGRFQDGQVTHPVGRSVFVFAGGTARRWAEFGKPRDDQKESDLTLLKVPDFKSRLDAHYDVNGPNQRTVGTEVLASSVPHASPDLADIAYTLRRAFLLRGQMRLAPTELFDIDLDLLRAMLLVPEYRHGARSMEKLVKALCAGGGEPVQRSNLPPPAQLDLHVDAARFNQLLGEGRAFEESGVIEEMAANIHAAYGERERRAGREPDKRFNKDYDALGEAEKQDNLAAARRIPAVLMLAGLGVASARDEQSPGPREDELNRILRRHLERLAEAEHDGWWDVRRRNGWTKGPRDSDKLIHPNMIPYADLSEESRDRDRASVLAYSHRLKEVGYRIVWLVGYGGDRISVPPGSRRSRSNRSGVKKRQRG